MVESGKALVTFLTLQKEKKKSHSYLYRLLGSFRQGLHFAV